MYWPTPQDYNEAIQNPAHCFDDPELRLGKPELTPYGLPRPTTGAFATVYRLNCKTRSWAIRCFLHEIPDQHERYLELSKFILSDDLVYTVNFEFIEQGIRVKGHWYPMLKMEWVEGVSLTKFIEQNLNNADKLLAFADRFAQMMQEIRHCGIAHGDLQHGNIMFSEGDIRLVDYDGMYVPSLRGWQSNELGHRNYQHPARTKEHFGPYLDNFSAWVIYLTLRFLAIDPQLWRKTYSGDECLLFRRADYLYPESSSVFHLLEHHSSLEIRSSVSLFHSTLQTGLEAMPEIEVLGADLLGRKIRHPNMMDRLFWSFKAWTARQTRDQQPIGQELAPPGGSANNNQKPLPNWLKDMMTATTLSNQPAISAVQPRSTQIPDKSALSGPAPLTQQGLPDWMNQNNVAQNPSPAASPQTNSENPPPTTDKVEVHARKLVRQSTALHDQNKLDQSVQKLEEALNLVSGKYLKLELEILGQCVKTHMTYGEQYFNRRKYIAASRHFEKAMESVDEMSKKRGGLDQSTARMASDFLEKLSFCYEQDGKFDKAIEALDKYLKTLNQLPQTSEKIKRANKRREELTELLTKG